MNRLLSELHRLYADEGVPCLEQQARDLARLAVQDEAERTAAAIRAVKGFVKATRAQARRDAAWERNLPGLMRRQAW